MSELELENKELKEEIEQLRQQVKMLEEKVASHITSRNQAQRTYYKKHTDVAQQRTRSYLDNLKETDPERLKEYRHTAYINRKARLQRQKEETDKKEAE
jgi:hypothetical protein